MKRNQSLMHQIDLTHLEYALTGACEARDRLEFWSSSSMFLSQTVIHLLEVMMKVQSI